MIDGTAAACFVRHDVIVSLAARETSFVHWGGGGVNLDGEGKPTVSVTRSASVSICLPLKLIIWDLKRKCSWLHTIEVNGIREMPRYNLCVAFGVCECVCVCVCVCVLSLIHISEPTRLA